MARYSDDIVDQFGAPVAGASIYVYDQGGALADLTADGGGDLANPVTSDAYGGFYFNAEDGLYTLEYRFGGRLIERDQAVMVGEGLPLPDSVLTALAAPGASALIGHLPAGASAIASTEKAYLDRGPIFAESFRDPAFVPTAGNTADREVLQKAFAAWVTRGGGEIHLQPNRTYDLGNETVQRSTITAIVGITHGRLCGNNATIQINTTGDFQSNLLTFWACQDVVVQDLIIKDTGTDVMAAFAGGRGVNAIIIDGDSGIAKNLTFENLRIGPVSDAFRIQGEAPGANRVRGVQIRDCVIEDSYYALNCQNNGDDVDACFTSKNVRRSYFPYGVRRHRIKIYITHDGAGPTAVAGITDACCLIKCYNDDTRDIDLDVTYGSPIRTIGGAGGGTIDPWGNLVKIEHSSGGATGNATHKIDSINITLNVLEGVTDSGTTTRLRFSSYQANDGAEIVGASNHQVGRVSLAGNLGKTTIPHVKANYTPNTPIVLALHPALGGLTPVKLVDGNNIIIKPAVDRMVMQKFGALNAAMAIPIPDLATYVWAFKVKVYAEVRSDGATSGAISKMHYREDFVPGYSLVGAANAALLTGGAQAIVAPIAMNGSNLTIAYSGGTDVLTITPGGSDYNVATAYMRVEIELIARPAHR